MITPLTQDGDVDHIGLERLARRLLSDGCAGLVVLGTTGEPATLSAAEKQRVMETCATACAEAGRPMIVGTGSNCTRSTIEDALRVENLVHPAALLVVVPYFTRPSESSIVEHFRAVAGAVATPLVVYNIPHRTGRGLGADSILELAEMPAVIGLKQSVGGLDHDTLEILRRRPATFELLTGDDAYIVPTVLMGGAGAIAASAHLFTARFALMVDAALRGDVDTAVAMTNSLLPVVDHGFAEPNPALWKAALHAAGEIATPELRPPMAKASPEATVALLEAVASVATSPLAIT